MGGDNQYLNVDYPLVKTLSFLDKIIPGHVFVTDN